MKMQKPVRSDKGRQRVQGKGTDLLGRTRERGRKEAGKTPVQHREKKKNEGEKEKAKRRGGYELAVRKGGFKGKKGLGLCRKERPSSEKPEAGRGGEVKRRWETQKKNRGNRKVSTKKETI